MTKRRFIILYLLIAVLPLLVASSYMYVGSRSIASDGATENLDAVANGKVRQVEQAINSALLSVQQVATGPDTISDVDTYNKTHVLRPDTEEGAAKRVTAVFLRSQRNPSLADIQAVSIADINGIIIASSDSRQIGKTLKSSPDIEFVQNQGADAYLTIRQPLFLPDGKTKVGELEFTAFGRADLKEILTGKSGVGVTSDTLYVRKFDGVFTTSASNVEKESTKVKNKLSTNGVLKSLDEGTNSEGKESYSDGSYFYSLKTIAGTKAAVVVTISTTEVFSVSNQMRNVVAFFALFILLLGFLVYVGYSRLQSTFVLPEKSDSTE